MEKVDYTAILADIDAKIAALESAKASLTAAWASGALGSQAEMPESASSFSAGASYELPRGALLGKSIPSAIKLYLDAIKKKQTIKQIAQALKDGGVESTAGNFENVVTGSLNRLKSANEVLRFKDGWGLTEHYPNHLRKAFSQEPKTVQKKAKSKNARKKKGKHSTKPEATKSSKTTNDRSPISEQKVQSMLDADKAKCFSPQEMADALHLDKVGTLSLILGNLVKKEKAKKVEGGKYQAMNELILSAV